ncbi:DUF3907 family protein [Hazenella sp. IB182357]|uniref:DUF3907 family protein n=2 Tax=Polycladospora coralii TaxID=2771432 RepID=A0A926N7J7_9BACL|nr:DUF3907 family protein [Polycladospora coralii]MBS7529852.1 DUF3907 family protein [Polycladospora coralii]
MKKINTLLENFLNEYSVKHILDHSVDGDCNNEAYIRQFLSDLRHLSVACELGYERVSLVLRRAHFNPEFADKVLSEIMHTSIYKFYYPKNEVYEEDGRYSYTSFDAIKFRETPPKPLRELIIQLSKIFEVLRDELDYYETDYITRTTMRNMNP